VKNSLGDDLDRTPSGRFVRNLALSLSGGALLTLLGASAAHAQDAAQAGTDSDGSGAAHSGDATAVGNHSATDASQTGTVSGTGGNLQIIGQQANVTNQGAAVADTGHNTATGNQSGNNANTGQVATSASGGAVNNGQAANASDGSAAVSTGDASAVGNWSSTSVTQTAHGGLGGILIINQDTTVTNSGLALASSGRNDAVGNESENTGALLSQNVGLAGGLASNGGKATNGSDGKATIATGNASATGNHSDTMVTQSASGSAGGDPGGLVLIDQGPVVTNEGSARARTGRNTATGNTSSSTANVEQGIGDIVTPTAAPDVAANQGEGSDWSDGTARITTGDAVAVGNESSTTIDQTANADDTADNGLSVITQDAEVTNQGRATATTGRNTATGNDSRNDLKGGGTGVTQTIDDSDAIDTGVLSNSGKATTASDGSASIATGGADAAGNRSTTGIAQSAVTNGGDFNLYPQSATVTNAGRGSADSGRNEAVGNDSENSALLDQEGISIGDPVGTDIDAGTLVGSNSGTASVSSDGGASITTGNASAVGNASQTTIGQSIDPTGLVLPVQVADVVNAGLAVANSGDNTAEGNGSTNLSRTVQSASVGFNDAVPADITAGTLVVANEGEATNTSDGSASIATGDASATGNASSTAITQDSTGSVDGLGLVLNSQVAGVLNTGAGVANSGDNAAGGNGSTNQADIPVQHAEVGSGNGAGTTDITAGILTVTNAATTSNTSDGTAEITTGNASATGNRSATTIGQSEDAGVDGLGAVINTQAAGVANVGLGVANTGGNLAIGNISSSRSDLVQTANIGSDNFGDTEVDAGVIAASDSGASENLSDGTGRITTGDAAATGNASTTELEQASTGDVNGLGLVVNTQVGGVLNAGVGVANSGLNLAVGNAAQNHGNDNTPGASVNQTAQVGTNNSTLQALSPTDIDVLGPLVAANSGSASNTSDGTGTVATGAAEATGNASSTQLSQSQDGTIDGTGLAIDTQVGGVANVGVGVANSGLNAAVGNVSTNRGDLGQNALVGSQNGGPTDLTVLGPLTANNAGDDANTSDGSAAVATGNATATGNASSTNLSQHQTGDVTDMGLALGTQVGGVANLGIGVANSGLNAAIGNVSTNFATASQDASVASRDATPPVVTVVGPLAANNSGQLANTSDGEAAVRTGNAVASGNVSSTSLVQDLDISVGSGVVVFTEAGGVLNAGLGLANSGLNLAVGNVSDNTASSLQTSIIDDGLVDPVVGPQIAHDGGGASNTSDGAAFVGSGNASATGNLSTTNLVQAATVDPDFAVATLAAGTTNTGLGLANSGTNVGIGNASTNTARLTQAADGAGIVSNDGTAENRSDGTATIGNPNAEAPGVPGVPGGPGATTPGASTLPKTGGPLEAEALFGLMLLLAGFGLRRKGTSLA
jgi:hypothetical protein